MNPSNSDNWQKLSASRRQVLEADRQSRGDSAPFGFATRVVARWQDMVRSERFVLWRRWSLRAAFCSLLLVLVTAAWNRKSEAAPPALEVPQLSPP